MKRRPAVRSRFTLRIPPVNQAKHCATLGSVVLTGTIRSTYVAVVLFVRPDCAPRFWPHDSVNGSVVITGALQPALEFGDSGLAAISVLSVLVLSSVSIAVAIIGISIAAVVRITVAVISVRISPAPAPACPWTPTPAPPPGKPKTANEHDISSGIIPSVAVPPAPSAIVVCPVATSAVPMGTAPVAIRCAGAAPIGAIPSRAIRSHSGSSEASAAWRRSEMAATSTTTTVTASLSA
jgi:hypothetical protein